MQKAIDPLILLREHLNSNTVEKKGEYLYFGEGFKLKLDTPTGIVYVNSNQTTANRKAIHIRGDLVILEV